jgi:hypothetical protein
MTTTTTSADGSNNDRRRTKVSWKHRPPHFAIWAGLVLAITGTAMNVSTMARTRIVDLDYLFVGAGNLTGAIGVAIASDTTITKITNINQTDKLKRGKQDFVSKLAAIEKVTAFQLETKPTIGSVLMLSNIQPTLGANEVRKTSTQTTKSASLELDTTTIAAPGPFNVSISNYSQYYTPLKTPNLWDNSTLLPAWLKEYFHWHEQERSLVTADNWQSFRFLIPTARKGYKSGGMTDRIRPLPALLRVAAQTHRILLLHWSRPFALEEFIMPPQGGLDWRVPSYMVPKVVTIDPVQKLEQIRKKANTPKKLLTCRYQSWNYGELWYNEETSQGESSVHQAFRDIWKVLFTPSFPVAQRIQDDFRRMALVPGEFATAHIRALYAVEDRPEAKIQAMAKNAMNCVSNLRPGGPFFVASDSSLAISFSLSYGKMMNVTVVTANHPKQPLHVDFNNESDTTVTPADFYDGFVDMYLMAATRCAAVGPGGFARWGHLLGYNDSCVIYHTGRKSQRCEWIASAGNTPTPGYPSEEARRSNQQEASTSELLRFPMPMI